MSLLQKKNRRLPRNTTIYNEYQFSLMIILWEYKNPLQSKFADEIKKSLEVAVPNVSSYTKYCLSDLVLGRYCVAGFFAGSDATAVVHDILLDKSTILFEKKAISDFMYGGFCVNRITGDVSYTRN